MAKQKLRSAIAALTALGEPQRLRLFEFVADSREPVSRDDAARALDMKRSLVAFHLDKLVEQGFLETEFRHLGEKRGPGAGRPAKLYFRSSREFEVSTPERHYDTAAQLLASGISESVTSGVSVEEGIKRAASEYGKALGEQLADEDDPVTVQEVCGLLEDNGYEPINEGGAVTLRNCPFHKLAKTHTDLVCSMNLAIFEAIDEDVEGISLNPRLEPSPGHCCVRLHCE